MKGIVTAFFLVVTSFTIQCQIGFNKKFNLGRSNSFLGSAINNDTLLVLGSTTDFVNGWQFSAIAIDTNGIIINDNKYEKDSFQLLSWGGYNSKLLISNSIGKNIAIIDESHRRELQIYFFDNDGKIRKKTSFKIAKVNENYIYFGVLKVSDGYLISGQVQYSSETVKSFILKIDRDGNKIYLKYYGEKDFWFLGSTLYQSPVYENEVVLSGSYISHGYGHKSFFHIEHKTGNILRIDITPGQTINTFEPFSI